MKTYAAIVLAAGASKRLGKPKQLLPYKESTLLNHTITELLKLQNVDVYVVLGAYADAILLTIHKLKVTPLIHSGWEDGMGSSLAFGMKAIADKNYDGVLVSLSDLPFIKTEHYQKLLSDFEQQKSIVITDYQNFSGVPCMIPSQHFSELQKLTGDEGAKPVIEKYKKEVSKVNSETPYFDVDTDESYEQLLRLS